MTRIYGIEPHPAFHDKLRVRIKEAKLTDIYTIVPCGIDDASELQKYGISRESIDTVLTCQVLCSVPQPEETARHLYRLLKRGGKLIAYEHIRSQDTVSRAVQGASLRLHLAKILPNPPVKSKNETRDVDSYVARTGLYNLVWPYGAGNCHLDRPTDRYLQNAGAWSKIDLEIPTHEDAWQVLPRVSGQLIK